MIRKWLYFTNLRYVNFQQEIDSAHNRINESKTIQRLVQEERKACRGFGGAEMNYCETKNKATLCHRHRK